MERRTEGLVGMLRTARRQKGWSQRDLSAKAGLTQAHLSRIEGGAVDLKLSTFVELARLLDLEPILAPRTALSAVDALIREADANQEARTVRGVANALQQVVQSLRPAFPKHPQIERLADLVPGLHSLEPLFRTPAALTELLSITAEIRRTAGNFDPDADQTPLKRALDRLAALRNTLVHGAQATQRPAYTLDDEA